MGALAERLSNDLKDAMRSGDSVRRDEIRGLLAALKAERQSRLTRELDKRGLLLRDESASLTAEQLVQVSALQGSLDLNDEEEQAILQQRVKQHRQSIEAFQQGLRADLLATEQAQLAVLERYLPEQLDDQQVEATIQAAIQEAGATTPRDQGKVMQVLSPRLRGRADMRQVSARVQALLTTSA